MVPIQKLIRTCPFTLVGAFSTLIFWTFPLLPEEVAESPWVRLPLYPFIVLAYLPRLLLMISSAQQFGPGGPPTWFGSLALVLPLLPFILVDGFRALIRWHADRVWRAGIAEVRSRRSTQTPAPERVGDHGRK